MKCGLARVDREDEVAVL